MELTLGITGLMRCGKDTIADYLVQNYNYQKFNMSDVLKEELIRQGKEPSKMNMSILGDEWRNIYGYDIVMRRTLEKAKNFKKIIITGVRSTEEVQFLKKNSKRFKLICVDTPQEQRFSRRLSSDPQSSEEFFQRDTRDIQQKGLGNVIKLADYTISNGGSEHETYNQIIELINRIEYIRPSWDDYFMSLAREVGKRGTCDRGRCGAVIVKNKRILCTGYIGSPTGLPHCDEIGHQMKSTIHEDGSISHHCVRGIHAESNAIAQAARFGISLDNSTVYVKFEPCFNCAKLIINSGIKRVVAEKMYHAASDSRKLLEEAEVKLETINLKLEAYDKQ